MSHEALLERYRELQNLEGVTIEDERAIAREQGQVWRDYVRACERAGIRPASSESPRLGHW